MPPALLAAARKRQPQFLRQLRALVSAESPSTAPESDPALPGLHHCAALLTDHARALVPAIHLRRIPTRTHGDILHFSATLPGSLPSSRSPKSPPILCLGHYDTVYPAGTLRHQPFRLTPSRAYGPGTLDMKSGLLLFFHALALALDFGNFADSGSPARRISLLAVPDEEIGSPASRAVTEDFARRIRSENGFVLVLEPATATGALKTARKGIADYSLTIHGRAAHSGIDFADGASAIIEAAHQIQAIAALSRSAPNASSANKASISYKSRAASSKKRNSSYKSPATSRSRSELRSHAPASSFHDDSITLNPGILRGGSALNIVAPLATLDFEARLSRLRDFAPLDRKLRALRPFDPRCTLSLAGGLNRPPMERSPATARLFARAATLARRHLGLSLTEAATGGASDGNFTAALGLPTLDGLGPTGAGAHSPNEHILLNSIAPRMALLALLFTDGDA
jgi:glutamate carboxypeptidase